jgi:hypothetical protein
MLFDAIVILEQSQLGTLLSVNVVNMFENFVEHTVGPVTTISFMDGPAWIGFADTIEHT